MNSSFFSSVMAVFDKGQPLVYTFIPSFIPNMILLKVQLIRVKTSNNVSEFMHSNFITLSYYSIPKYKESAS